MLPFFWPGPWLRRSLFGSPGTRPFQRAPHQRCPRRGAATLSLPLATGRGYKVLHMREPGPRWSCQTLPVFRFLFASPATGRVRTCSVEPTRAKKNTSTPADGGGNVNGNGGGIPGKELNNEESDATRSKREIGRRAPQAAPLGGAF
ncbi:hypothetical protein SKAU_G00147250 [Synaphobranchus kaupii]|uniref:Uncharacterized protein n=1 Tax=Synaphobranchus kaupii TaxID=118154 RepID=A0A9Q1FTS9_SYNKA|nr:hypothetical protein SKAU_G00147250 [Synaphobranchus kaupii]